MIKLQGILSTELAWVGARSVAAGPPLVWPASAQLLFVKNFRPGLACRLPSWSRSSVHDSHAFWKFLESSGNFPLFKVLESSGNKYRFWKVLEIWLLLLLFYPQYQGSRGVWKKLEENCRSDHYSGQSSNTKESCISTPLNRCTRTEMRWNKKAVSRSSPEWWVIIIIITNLLI